MALIVKLHHVVSSVLGEHMFTERAELALASMQQTH